MSIVILGERPSGAAREAQTSRLSLRRVRRAGDINEVLDVLIDVVAGDVPSSCTGIAS